MREQWQKNLYCAVGWDISSWCPSDSVGRQDMPNIAKEFLKLQCHPILRYWPQFPHTSSVYWPGIKVMISHFFRIIGRFNCQHSRRSLSIPACMTADWVHQKEESQRKCWQFSSGINSEHWLLPCVACNCWKVKNVVSGIIWGIWIFFPARCQSFPNLLYF